MDTCAHRPGWASQAAMCWSSRRSPRTSRHGGAAVADHHGRAFGDRPQPFPGNLTTCGGWGGIHFLDHHCPVGNSVLLRRGRARLRTVRLEPTVHLGRIPDEDRRMRAKRQRRFGPFAVLIRPNETSGVAQPLVDFPTFTQVPVTEVPEVFAELCLVFVKGKRAWLPHNRLELIAQRRIAGNLSGLLFVRASGRRRALHACKRNENGRERSDRTARAPNARNVAPQKHLETCPRYSGWHRAIPSQDHSVVAMLLSAWGGGRWRPNAMPNKAATPKKATLE